MKFGLIGDKVSHSFSADYFKHKFDKLDLVSFSYKLIPVPSIADLSGVLRSDYFGLNITKPYKSAIIPYLNEIDTDAFKIGAVNTLVRTGKYSWKGFNTDHIGFEQSLMTWIAVYELPEKALILGSGGAAKAVAYVLSRLGVEGHIVSASGKGDFSYEELTDTVMQQHRLIINTTPLGMAPKPMECPAIPFTLLTNRHWVFDLVYNPTNTVFLARSQQEGAQVRNGLEMLYLQADYAWSIWKTYGKF